MGGLCRAVEPPTQGKLESVADGDTIRVIADGESYRVRLIGVDSPEAYPSERLDKDSERSGKDTEALIALGKRSTEFTRALLPKSALVRLEYDPANAAQGHRDKYKRLLAYVWTASEEGKPLLVNAEIIRQGFGNAMTQYPYDRERQELLLKLQREAKEAKRGLWGDEGKPAAQTPAPAEKSVLVGSKLSKKYHRPECRWAQKIGADNRVEFKDAAEAKAAGYSPCKVCKPQE